MSLRTELQNKSFRFDRTDASIIGIITLNSDGTIGGISSYNETFWMCEDTRLMFENGDHETTTVFDEVISDLSSFALIGTFLPTNKRHWHRITELAVTSAMIADLQELMFGKHGDAFDIIKCAELAAAFNSANYYSEHMLGAKPFADKFSFLTDAMRKSLS